MQYMDGYQNGYENALSDVDNTLDYIKHQLAFIKQWEEKHSTIQEIEGQLKWLIQTKPSESITKPIILKTLYLYQTHL